MVDLVQIIGAVVVILLAVFVRILLNPLRLPPGPRPWPIVGNLPHLGRLAHKALTELSKTYGPLMFLKLGSNPTVVVSSPDLVKEFLVTQGELFASRTDTLAGNLLGYNRQTLSGAPYGQRWHQLRKILSTELLSPKRVQMFEYLRKDEILNVVQSILDESKDGHAVHINQKMLQLNNNVITRMLFNKSYCGLKTANGTIPSDAREFQDLIVVTTTYSLEFFLGNFLWYLKAYDPNGLKPRMRTLKAKWDEFLDNIIQQHRAEKDNQDSTRIKDFVDMLIAVQNKKEIDLTDDLMKGLLKDMIIGGTDTSANQTSWTIVEVVRHPAVQKKLQDELDSVVGRERLVEESDIPNLPYLRAVVKESFRFRPILPLLLPHESINSKPVKVAGYDIPPRSALLVNVYGIHMNPSVWQNPEQFDPERFVDSPIEPKGQHFELVPFGSGRRVCPGLNMALLILQRTIAQLFQSFEWGLPENTSLEVVDDMEVHRGIIVAKSIPYKISPRLPSTLYSRA